MSVWMLEIGIQASPDTKPNYGILATLPMLGSSET